MCKIKVRANAVRFNQKTGVGKIVIKGNFKTLVGIVDDPVIEIWNAVQCKMQTAILKAEGKKLIHFTPFFPNYDAEKDETVYQLMPSKPDGLPIKAFLAEAKLTIEIFYKNLFLACFRQFLEDENKVANYNGYSLYKSCLEKVEAEKDSKKRAYDIATTKMLLENFIGFLGLPLPESKEACERRAMQASLSRIHAADKDIDKLHNLNNVELVSLLKSQDAFDEVFDYAEDA